MPEWIVFETLSGSDPRVILVGRKPVALKPISSVVRGPRRAAIRSAVDAAVETGRSVRHEDEGGRFQVVADPCVSPLGRTNAVRVCAFGMRDSPPAPIAAGAWVWDLDRGTVLLSDELLDMRGLAGDAGQNELTSMQGLEGVSTTSPGHTAVLAAVMSGEDGTEVQDVWRVEGPDKTVREIRFVGRIERTADQRRWLHGVTCDITAESPPQPAPQTFAESVIEAELAVQHGVYTIMFDLESLRPVRWLSAPLEELQYRITGDPARDPAIHPDDIPELKRMAREVVSAPTQAQLRVRGTDGAWRLLHCTAVLMMLDRSSGVHAALVKLRVLPGDRSM